MKKIAILSNININPVARLLKKEFDVYETEGYGNELELLLNKGSSLYGFHPEAIFLIEDTMEMIHHELSEESAKRHISNWFETVTASMDPGCEYFISDAYLYGNEMMFPETRKRKRRLECLWDDKLDALIAKNPNVYVFPYRVIIEAIGEEKAFSRKMWYLGKVLHSMDAHQRICEEIVQQIRINEYMPKKVLVLDLDYTLWGGIAGETDLSPVNLSDDGAGLFYKDTQRVIRQIKDNGAVLCIVSKNNEADAMDLIANHPHMVLRPDDFAILEINWNDKASNIRKIVDRLNVGLDSFVFIDDSEHERQLVREMLPEVEVPDFPEKVDLLPEFMVRIFRTYFEKSRITKEDTQKTRQYILNERRSRLLDEMASFHKYLAALNITVTRVDAAKNVDRVLQLVNKTNQFNLTTRRYTMPEMERALSGDKKVYSFRVSDKFGDSGIVAVLIVDTEDEVPVMEEFTMSCRVMGRNIEYGLIDYVEKDLIRCGYDSLYASYIPTQKNRPVAGFYENLGYELEEEKDGEKRYRLDLHHRKERNFLLKFIEMEADTV